jgi:hypothetical protein
VAALQAYNERVAEVRSANKQAQLQLRSAQQNVQRAQANVAATTERARRDYAAYVSQINVKRRREVESYNTQMLSGLHSIADDYSREVADINLRLAQRSSGPTRLLGTNIRAAMQAAQLTYQPLPTELPTMTTKERKEIAGARRVGLNNPTTQAYRELKTNLPRAATEQQIDAAVARANEKTSAASKAT